MTQKDNTSDALEDGMVDRLVKAIRTDGDFPVSARIANEIVELSRKQDSSSKEISKLILQDPTLGVRVLQLVNGPAYAPARPITTVSQAVVLIGMKQLADMCAGLILLEKFVPLVRQGGVFARCLQRAVSLSVVSNLVFRSANDRDKTEAAYLIGLLAEMGPLLLAFYFPQQCEKLASDGNHKARDYKRSIQDLCGLSNFALSGIMVRELGMPALYAEALERADKIDKSSLNWGAEDPTDNLAVTLFVADQLTTNFIEQISIREFDNRLHSLIKRFNVPVDSVVSIIHSARGAIREYSESLDIPIPELCEYLDGYSLQAPQPTAATTVIETASLEKYLKEMREAIETNQPSSVVMTTAMEALLESLGFHRVVLLVPAYGSNKMVARMTLGDLGGIDPQSIEPTEAAGGADVTKRALSERRPVFRGPPLLPGGAPAIALPVGGSRQTVGVIYADKVDAADKALSYKEIAAMTLLSDLLERSGS